MDFVPNELLVFLVRWAHVIAGIMWIGNSFYFMWLDANLELPEKDDADSEGALWMVHSGGFYQVERRKIRPGEMPVTLHWFKWEATLTWVTGFFLLGLVFYLRNATLLVNHEQGMLSGLTSVGASLGILVFSWLIYDLLWVSPVVKKELLAVVLSLLLLVGLTYFCTVVFSGRGAFIHVGAVLGTLMVLNVWVRILPAQKAMISATENGERADFSLAKKAKLRSTHNSYMTLPVLFAMLGGHFSTASSHPLNWAVITLFVVLGMISRHIMILYTKKQTAVGWLVPWGAVLAIMAALIYWPTAQVAGEDHAEVSVEEAFSIVQARCVSCHAADPTDKTFGSMPGGVSLETRESMIRFADKIHFMAVETKTMPLANKTQMSDVERDRLGRWTQKVLNK